MPSTRGGEMGRSRNLAILRLKETKLWLQSLKQTQRRRLARLCAVSFSLILVACETTPMATVAIEKSVPCSQLHGISWSTRDTDLTIATIKEFNAMYLAVCVGKPASVVLVH